MRTIFSTRLIEIPSVVTVEVSARKVVVKGPKGTLSRDFRHVNVDMQKVDGGKAIKVDVWFGTRESVASIRTVCSHIENMINGVQTGFKYKMRFCYAHFPINVSAVKEGNKTFVEIRNFLGEKKVRRVELLEGCSYFRTPDVKDQIEISGIDINNVSLSCAKIQQSTLVKNKDIRKFLDGIYVSEKGTDTA